MKQCGLRPEQMDEVLAVLNNEHQLDFKSGAIRVNTLSRPALAFLKSNHWIKKQADGRYHPDFLRSDIYPTFSTSSPSVVLPVDILWRVVEPMLNEGHAGYAITANKRWGLLNLYSKGQHGYTGTDEQEIMRVLGELAAYGYIWYQFGGSVWAIDRRKDHLAA